MVSSGWSVKGYRHQMAEGDWMGDGMVDGGWQGHRMADGRGGSNGGWRMGIGWGMADGDRMANGGWRRGSAG